ncbi:hypothetical protein DSC45_34695 [Streptomyces sp. YIM 130001]|uniref:hypothetical protein n=1 Tax=Streptomyces sp. YIM 130001 TaxID=2259644 RepID=UPI000EEC560F|nr:hypothetical protein [Streptomyces sp. YIM 130001]RII06979.1 hypothetical protein DSC45_34695 [Streptomyces sp. YIM 130001]
MHVPHARCLRLPNPPQAEGRDVVRPARRRALVEHTITGTLATLTVSAFLLALWQVL